LGDYHQTVIGQDISFAWHHLQIWAEAYESRWRVPNVGNADTFSYYIESKYKLTPQLFAALRWNQQFYSNIDDPADGALRWGNDLWRADAAFGYRFTAHTQMKLEYSLQRESESDRTWGHVLAAQFTLRF
jgi:predicted porin